MNKTKPNNFFLLFFYLWDKWFSMLCCINNWALFCIGPCAPDHYCISRLSQSRRLPSCALEWMPQLRISIGLVKQVPNTKNAAVSLSRGSLPLLLHAPPTPCPPPPSFSLQSPLCWKKSLHAQMVIFPIVNYGYQHWKYLSSYKTAAMTLVWRAKYLLKCKQMCRVKKCVPHLYHTRVGVSVAHLLSTQCKAFGLSCRRWEKIGVEGLRKYTASIERCACVTAAEGGHQNIGAKGWF